MPEEQYHEDTPQESFDRHVSLAGNYSLDSVVGYLRHHQDRKEDLYRELRNRYENKETAESIIRNIEQKLSE